jgi:high-affinity iron transporter
VLSTFVIGLREGLEAALIVGIVAAFLRTQGRADRLRYVWVGVAAAVAVCMAFAITLQVVSADLPERQQEVLESVIGLVAVAMVTYMIVWMRRHARDLKGHLERSAGTALASGSAWALVAMAVLAVLREGFETSVFLLAAFQASVSPVSAGGGAVLGILVAIGLGYGIYRGGVKLNLAKFFTVTGVVLVVVAAGLFATAFHTGHEAGWINFGQAQVLDLSWLIRPGSVLASVFTGLLGFQPKPTVVELLAWAAYVVPLGAYVLWPTLHRRRPATATPASHQPSQADGPLTTAR